MASRWIIIAAKWALWARKTKNNIYDLFYPELSVARYGVVIRIVDENTFVTWLMFNISLAIVKFFL